MIRVALIGYGHWGPNYLRNLLPMDQVQVTVVCDSNTKALAKIQKIAPHIRAIGDYNAILEDSNIDAVIIAVPATLHYTLTRKALLAGKHVLVEKPLALKVSEAEELTNLAEKKERILMVGHTFLYNSAVRKMKEYIERGTLGKIYYLQSARTHLGLIRTDVSAVWDLAPHDVSIFNYLLGQPPTRVSAVGMAHLNPQLEDVAFLNFFYGDKVLGSVHISWIDSNKQRQLSVIGSKARVFFDDLNPLEKIRFFEKGVSLDKPYENFGEFQLLLRDGDILSPKIEPEEPLRNVCEDFIQCVLSGRKPVADGRNGLELVCAMVAAQESIGKNGVPVDIIYPSKVEAVRS